MSLEDGYLWQLRQLEIRPSVSIILPILSFWTHIVPPTPVHSFFTYLSLYFIPRFTLVFISWFSQTTATWLSRSVMRLFFSLSFLRKFTNLYNTTPFTLVSLVNIHFLFTSLFNGNFYLLSIYHNFPSKILIILITWIVLHKFSADKRSPNSKIDFLF